MLVSSLLLVFALVTPAFAQRQEAAIRIAHLSPDVPYVDVYVDGQPVGSLFGLSYGTVSSYVPLPGGTRNVEIYASGDASAPLLDADLAFGAGEAQTLGLVGVMRDGTLDARIYKDDTTPPPGNRAELRAVQAVLDVGAASVTTLAGEQLLVLPDFSYASTYARVSAGPNDLQLRPAGTNEVALAPQDVVLAPGVTYTAFFVGATAYGTTDVILVQDSAVVAEPSLADTGGAPLPLAAYLVLQLAGLSIALLLLARRHGPRFRRRAEAR